MSSARSRASRVGAAHRAQVVISAAALKLPLRAGGKKARRRGQGRSGDGQDAQPRAMGRPGREPAAPVERFSWPTDRETGSRGERAPPGAVSARRALVVDGREPDVGGAAVPPWWQLQFEVLYSNWETLECRALTTYFGSSCPGYPEFTERFQLGVLYVPGTLRREHCRDAVPEGGLPPGDYSVFARLPGATTADAGSGDDVGEEEGASQGIQLRRHWKRSSPQPARGGFRPDAPWEDVDLSGSRIVLRTAPVLSFTGWGNLRGS